MKDLNYIINRNGDFDHIRDGTAEYIKEECQHLALREAIKNTDRSSFFFHFADEEIERFFLKYPRDEIADLYYNEWVEVAIGDEALGLYLAGAIHYTAAYNLIPDFEIKDSMCEEDFAAIAKAIDRAGFPKLAMAYLYIIRCVWESQKEIYMKNCTFKWGKKYKA